jgi:hypothetical protein
MTVFNRAGNHLDTLQRPNTNSNWKRDSKSFVEVPSGAVSASNGSNTLQHSSSSMLLDAATAEMASFVNSLVKQMLLLTVLRKKIVTMYVVFLVFLAMQMITPFIS